MTKIETPGQALSQSDVQNLEKKLGVTLPDDYRNFLLTYNGGSPRPEGIDIQGYGDSDVQVFFGIGRAIESSCIGWNLETLGDRLPEGLVPVASDSGGNVFCISLRKQDYGFVLYADLDAVFGDLAAGTPLYRVAANFLAFLESLGE